MTDPLVHNELDMLVDLVVDAERSKTGQSPGNPVQIRYRALITEGLHRHLESPAE